MSKRPAAVQKLPKPPLPAPSPEEQKAIAVAKSKHLARSVRATSGMTIKDGKAHITNPHSDGTGWEMQLRNAFGTRSKDFVNANISYFASVFGKTDAVNITEVDAVLAVLDGAEPQNEIEAMLVIQMAITHVLAMRSARTLALSTSIPQQDSNGLSLHRLSRTFTSQIEALAKLKRGGEQKVTVEHVHVYPGGQAVVGNITHTGGTGGILGNPEQPYGPDDPRTLALAHDATVPCEKAVREAVPVAGDARPEALPSARRSARVRSAVG